LDLRRLKPKIKANDKVKEKQRCISVELIAAVRRGNSAQTWLVGHVKENKPVEEDDQPPNIIEPGHTPEPITCV
jgi:hypothetical protein